ncbi:MAG: DUF3105 domain-containing protein [Actinomycetota bacterium]|nr:DUF3105 domain-containing protein [Actinomycetota bacterium]
MAKQKSSDRKAIAEKLRREQQRKERIRSLSILGACGLVVVILLGAAITKYVADQRAVSKVQNTALENIGVSKAAAGCAPIKTKSAQGSGQHVTPPTPITYPDAPPAFGKHWGNYLTPTELRTFYTRSDAPQIERLVHSLEHGHTILWYDDSIKTGSQDYQAIQQLGSRLGADTYFMAAPYITALDGGTFPVGKHVALTHWTGPNKQTGVWEYCARPSGSVVKSFMATYPKQDAPEPGAA